MKIKLLILFCFATFLLPLSAFVIMGLLGMPQSAVLLKYSVSIALSLCSVIGFALYILKRKNLRWYWLLLILVFSLLIEVGTSPLRGYVSIPLCSVVTFILFFIFQYFILKKYDKRLKAEYILIASLIGCSLLQIVGRILQPGSLTSLPDFLFHLLGIVLGYLFYISGRISRRLILVFSLSSCLFLYFF